MARTFTITVPEASDLRKKARSAKVALAQRLPKRKDRIDRKELLTLLHIAYKVHKDAGIALLDDKDRRKADLRLNIATGIDAAIQIVEQL